MRTNKSELARLRAIKNVTQAIEFLGLSVAEFAERMPSQWKTHRHISAQLVCDWKRGRRKPSGTRTDEKENSQLNRIALLLAENVSRRYGREIGVKIVVNSPWKVTAWTRCATCKKYHELKSSRQKCKRAQNG